MAAVLTTIKQRRKGCNGAAAASSPESWAQPSHLRGDGGACETVAGLVLVVVRVLVLVLVRVVVFVVLSSKAGHDNHTSAGMEVRA